MSRSYVSVEQAIVLPGLRIAFSRGVPGPWGEAVRAIFDKPLSLAKKNGPVTGLPEKTRIAVQVRMSVAAFTIRRNWVDGQVVLARRLEK